jgi:hypothetical protein
MPHVYVTFKVRVLSTLAAMPTYSIELKFSISAIQETWIRLVDSIL